MWDLLIKIWVWYWVGMCAICVLFDIIDIWTDNIVCKIIMWIYLLYIGFLILLPLVWFILDQFENETCEKITRKLKYMVELE